MVGGEEVEPDNLVRVPVQAFVVAYVESFEGGVCVGGVPVSPEHQM